MGLTIRELVERAYGTSKAKGWHEEEKSIGDYLSLIHSEVSEGLESFRNGEKPYWIDESKGKPEGIVAELADVVIRVADMCGAQGWDLEHALIEKMDYNDTRPHRHGGKKLCEGEQ